MKIPVLVLSMALALLAACSEPVPQAKASYVGQWLGDSRGRWEGNTLIVETTNFNRQHEFRGATENLRLVERFTRLEADTIDYQVTTSDPATWTASWTAWPTGPWTS